jgi:hypothetical protein
VRVRHRGDGLLRGVGGSATRGGWPDNKYRGA